MLADTPRLAVSKCEADRHDGRTGPRPKARQRLPRRAHMLTIPNERRSQIANTVEISVVKRLGDTLIDVSARSSGAVTVLFDPSGSGKTSVAMTGVEA